jgi:hypothetical protein
MAITSGICSSFKQELGVLIHNFTVTTGDVFKLALYVSAATLSAATTVYSATNEVAGTGYSAGGIVVASVTPVLIGTTVIFDFADVSWPASTLTARGMMLYNSSKSNRSIFVYDFGSDRVTTAGTFSVTWPAADASNAIMRLA